MNFRNTWLCEVLRFYCEGFKSMTVGKTLWLIILLKLFVLFFIFRMFFFPDFLKSRFKTEEDRSEYVLEQLVR